MGLFSSIRNFTSFVTGTVKLARAGGDFETGEMPKKPKDVTAADGTHPGTTGPGNAPAPNAPKPAGWQPK